MRLEDTYAAEMVALRASPNRGGSPRKRHRIWRRVGIVLLVLVFLLGVGRAILPSVVRDYVNRTLDRNPLYDGNVGKVHIHLWRGAYSIEDVRLNKTTGNVPVPFFAAKRVDFAMEWHALLQRKVVGRVRMEQPEVNFVDAPSDEQVQTGEGTKKAVAAKPDADGQVAKGTNSAAQVEGKLALFDRLGGEKGIIAIVDDFTPRVLQDPRVNWQRKGVNAQFAIDRPRTRRILSSLMG